MSMRKLGTMMLIAVAMSMPALAPHRAPAQTSPSPNLDSLIAAVRDTMPAVRFKNSYDGGMRGNVSRVSLDHKVSSVATLRNGWLVNGSLSVGEASYRLQDRKENTRSFLSSVSMPLREGLSMSGSISDNRFFNRIVTPGGGSQDFKNDRQKAGATVSFSQDLPARIVLSGGGSAAYSSNSQTFQEDTGAEGALRGRVRYWITDRIRVNSGAYISKSARSAKTASQTEGGLGIDEDSLTTIVDFVVTDSTNVRVSYAQYTRTNEFLDQPRGVFGVQFEEDLNREVETRNVTDLSVSALLNPVPGLQLDITAGHSENETDFALQKTRFNRRVTDHLEGKFSYRLRRGTALEVTVVNDDILNDLGPESSGSYNEERRRVRFSLRHPFSRQFNVTAQAGASILQTFYEDFEVTPRDRDQLDRFANVRINSSPFPKITTSIYMAANQTEFVNIDVSLSGNNREETTFDFRPDITYAITPKIEIKQTYGLNIEFSDFVFNENDNFLDRTILFINTVTNKWTKRLRTDIEYQLRLHDRGSYLRPEPGADRLLDITQEDRRDQMNIRVRYQINEHLTLNGENDYSRRTDVFTSSETTDGGVEIGIQGNYNWGEGRKLTFNLRKVNRFGQFNSEEQEDYWVMDSSLSYAF